MPANLTPMYYEAEKRFRAAKTVPEKIAAIEEMLAVMPKHKGTDHLKGDLRRRIAKLSQSTGRKSATQRASMVVDKEGAAQLAVIGVPNAGKSQLVAAVTNAAPTVAEYPFTSHAITPGMMEFENIQIQLLDTPPLASGAVPFWMPHTLRRADALLIVVDAADSPLDQLVDISLQLEEMLVAVGPPPADGDDDPRAVRVKAMIVANKADLVDDAELRRTEAALAAERGGGIPVLAISARSGAGLEDLRLAVYRLLDIIRVYTKTPGQKADMTDPIVLDRGSTLEEAAQQVHKDFRARMKFGRVWGSGKHDGIMVKRDHVLEDGDIVELHM
ncbi:MAG: GTPase [Dehalococcoidales bacterium]